MTRKRSDVDKPNATRTVLSAVEIPPHANYSTLGENTSVVTANPVTQTPWTNPEDQGLIALGANPQDQRPISPRTNSQLQVVNVPLNTQRPGFQMSTTIVPLRTNSYPTYGMPFMPEVGISGHAQYITGLESLSERRQFSSPYTEYDSDPSSNKEVVHHRRRRRDKDPVGRERQYSRRADQLEYSGISGDQLQLHSVLFEDEVEEDGDDLFDLLFSDFAGMS